MTDRSYKIESSSMNKGRKQSLFLKVMTSACIFAAAASYGQGVKKKSDDQAFADALKLAIKKIGRPSDIQKINLFFGPQSSADSISRPEKNKYTLSGTCSTTTFDDFTEIGKILNNSRMHEKHASGDGGLFVKNTTIQIDIDMKNGDGYSILFDQENNLSSTSSGMFDSISTGTHFIYANKNVQGQVYRWLQKLYEKGRCQKIPRDNWVK